MASARSISPVGNLNVLKMIKEDLLIDLRALLHQARKTEKIASKEAIKIYNNKNHHEVRIDVIPKKNGNESRSRPAVLSTRCGVERNRPRVMAQKTDFADCATSARTLAAARACRPNGRRSAAGTPAHIEVWSARGRAAPEPWSRQGEAPDATAASEALMKPNDPKRAYFFAALTGSLTPSTVANSTL
jgi:hypothetical protein